MHDGFLEFNSSIIDLFQKKIQYLNGYVSAFEH